MRARIVSQVSISASAPEVFRYLVNLEYHRLWNPHLVRIPPRKTLEQGSQYKAVSMMFGIKISSTNVVSKLVSDKELQLENQAGTIHYRVNYKLESHPDSVEVVCTTAVTSTAKAIGLTAPLLKILAKRELEADLQALKVAVEQQLEWPDLL
jgi:hypothetical protein